MPGEAAFQTARAARETGLFFVMGEAGAGELGSIGAVRVTGKDGSGFLHSQLTNEVNALRPGEGNLTARVSRTGHILQIVSLRRLMTDSDGWPTYLLFTEKGAASALLKDLDRFLFADDVTLTEVSSHFTWMNIQGPCAREALRAALGEVPVSEDNAAAELHARDVPPGTLLLSHSISGDPGYVLAVPRTSGTHRALAARIESVARDHGIVCPRGEELGGALDILRIEAGIIRPGTDTPLRGRLLPETGLEHKLVSYRKGCYVGQEVIARVRTYGSLPFELRGLVINDPSDSLPASLSESLEDLPAVGEDLVLSDGAKIGQIISRTFSPVINAVVAMAYVDRAHRTPGTELAVRSRTAHLKCTVVLLPVYRAPENATRAMAVYEQAIRVFAEGQEERALAMLERALTIDPSFRDAYETVGVILGRSGRFEEAISIFERLEEVAPEEPMVNTNLSLYYMKIGDKPRAEEHSRRALRKSLAGASVGAGSRQEAAAVEDAKRRAEGTRKRELFSKVLEIDPEDPIALFGLGNALYVLEEWGKAEESYARAMDVQRNNSAIFLARGKALEKLGHREEALAVYKEGLEVASRRGDMTPLREIESRILTLDGERRNVIAAA
jgi:folate-binding protein YgfZ